MYSFLHKLLIIVGDLEFILSPAIARKNRARLFFDYLRLRIKASLSRWFHFKREHFLSYKVVFPDYEIFFVTFRQVFVREVYHVECKKESPQIIDCGGNIGMSVLYWKYIYPQAHITVFEPSREVLESLEKNIEQNNLTGVTLIRAATSAENGIAQMHQRGSAACGNTLERTVIEATPLKHEITSYEVPTVRLSEYITSDLDILKIDIEGSEGIVLNEVSRAQKFNQIGEFVLEYHYYPTTSDNRLADILSLFQTNGFEVQFYFEDSDSTTPLSLQLHGSYPISLHAARMKEIRYLN